MIQAFTATPATVEPGQDVSLAWTVTSADAVVLDQGVGAVTGTSVSVRPTTTTTYTLAATSSSGSSTRSVTVTVVPDSLLTVERPEPAGISCPSGGRSLASGTDVDQNGVLDTGEVSQVTYACNPPPALFDRRDAESSCPGGGVAIRHGLDTDGNGVLGDAEVTWTDYFCASAEPSGVPVGAYGAVGDGVTDDTLALRHAIAAAGTNGTIVLTPGRNYLISASLRMRPGQTLWGYGATIRRAPQVWTTTNTPIPAGRSPVTLQVADASGFWVGQSVGVFDGVLPAGSFDPRSHEIVGISGNTLTVGTSFTTEFPGGGTVVSSDNMIAADWDVDGTPALVSIVGAELDGNRAENGMFQRWEIHSTIYLAGDGTVIRDCYIHDSQSDGIILGGTGSVALGNIVVESSGNGIHFSGSTGAAASGNYVKDCNLDGPDDTSPVGHQDGCIISSNLVARTLVKDNYIENGIAGVGSIDSIDNSTATIQGNTIKNCGRALEGAVPVDESVTDIEFSGNYVFDSNEVTITGGGLPSGPKRFTVSNNYLENTTIHVANAQDVTIAGNTIWVGGGASAGIAVDGSAGVVVQSNLIGP